MMAAAQSASDADILTRLRASSSAEDFFTLLGVPYDPKVVNVARLHILKRMGTYLASENLSDVPASVATERCRAILERAYADFLKSSPIDERVFKVLKEAVAPPKPANFVPLDSLPPQEQLPAAPLLITAYAFVWVLLMLYLWSIAKRLGRVESDIQTLQRRGPG